LLISLLTHSGNFWIHRRIGVIPIPRFTKINQSIHNADAFAHYEVTGSLVSVMGIRLCNCFLEPLIKPMLAV